MTCIEFKNYKNNLYFRGSHRDYHLWIGLKDSTEVATCACSNEGSDACKECRVRYTWSEEASLPVTTDWWKNNEPGINERCIRLTDEGEWSGSPCDTLLDYVCYRGNYFHAYLRNMILLCVICNLILSDVDECQTNTHTCGENQMCVNTRGGYYCECVIGYTGDNCVTCKL